MASNTISSIEPHRINSILVTSAAGPGRPDDADDWNIVELSKQDTLLPLAITRMSNIQAFQLLINYARQTEKHLNWPFNSPKEGRLALRKG
jgi:hypothetical protein